MDIPINIHNGTKCITLPENMKNCKALGKSDDEQKSGYIYNSSTNQFASQGEYKYCCNTGKCTCRVKDPYYYSRITSIVILDKMEPTNLLKDKSLSSKLNKYYTVSQGNYGVTNDGNIDMDTVNMSGHIGNIYKSSNVYLYNNLLNTRDDDLKKNDRDFSWRIYSPEHGILAHEDMSVSDFTNKANSDKKKNWFAQYVDRRKYIQNESREMLPDSLKTIPKMIKWKEITKNATGTTTTEKYPIFRFIIDSNITLLTLDGFKKNIKVNGKYTRVAPIYPYMDGTLGPVFKKIDQPYYLWYIPLMDKFIHRRDWNTGSKKLPTSVFCCYCVQEIKFNDGIYTLSKNIGYSNNTGINGMKGEFIPRSGIWSEFVDNLNVSMQNVNVEYGGIAESFQSDVIYEGFNNQNLDKIAIDNNTMEHYNDLYLEGFNVKKDKTTGINEMEEEEKPKVDIGATCYSNDECVSGLCDTTGDYGCQNKCLRGKDIINKAKPSAYNCPLNFQELDNYYNDKLNISKDKIIKASEEAEITQKELQEKMDKYKNDFYNNLSDNIDHRIKRITKNYKPDESKLTSMLNKSNIQNYFDHLEDTFKKQYKAMKIDNKTSNVGDNVIDTHTDIYDRNNDHILNMQNEIDTIKRQSSIGLDTIIKNSKTEEFFKIITLYLLALLFISFLKYKEAMTPTIFNYVIFIVSCIFAILALIKFMDSKDNSGHSFKSKNFKSDKIINKVKDGLNSGIQKGTDIKNNIVNKIEEYRR